MSVSAARVSAPPLRRCTIFRGSLYLLVFTSVSPSFPRASWIRFRALCRFSRWLIKAFVSGAVKDRSFQCGWPHGWCSPTFCFSPSISGLSRAISHPARPIRHSILHFSPLFTCCSSQYRAVVLGANKSRLRFSSGPRVRVNSCVGDSYRRNRLPDFTRDFSGAGCLHLRRA